MTKLKIGIATVALATLGGTAWSISARTAKKRPRIARRP